MTDPALDGPDAERAIAKALGEDTPYRDLHAFDLMTALNEQGVVLCDEHALAELRQQAKAGEALIADLANYSLGRDSVGSMMRTILARHCLGDPR